MKTLIALSVLTIMNQSIVSISPTDEEKEAAKKIVSCESSRGIGYQKDYDTETWAIIVKECRAAEDCKCNAKEEETE